jgi:two-component system, sensor histidine kinase and response regulator
MTNKKVILLFENQIYKIEELETKLQTENWQIVVVNSNEKVLKIATEKTPDLIISRNSLPEIDSFRLLAELRNYPTTATIPIIILSDSVDLQEWRAAIEMGADDYLGKPFTISQLKSSIAAQFKKQLAFEVKVQKELEQLRQSITFSLPHELRTALTGILTSSDLLNYQLESLDLSTVRKIISCIHLSGRRLSHIVQNYLFYVELKTIHSNPQEIQKLRNIRLKSSAEAIKYVANRKAQQVDREIDLKLNLQDISVQIEQNHLLKLVEEILDNAFKFSKLGTSIEVISTFSKNYLVLSFCDRGIGITDEEISKIGAYIQFNRQTHEQQGSGLGLAIAKLIVEIYGGHLAIESIPYRETVVKVYLPTTKTHFKTNQNSSLCFENV